MSLALYHATLGYYRRPHDPFGIAGDYYTNAQMQPVFGRLLAQKIAALRDQLGAPADFAVVELGPGRGETGRVIRECLPGIRYFEIGPGMGVLPQGITGVIFSNEFFDALPVHVIRYDKPASRIGDRGRSEQAAAEESIRERFIELDNHDFAWVEAPPSTVKLAGYIKRYVPSPASGQIVEVNLDALEWIEQIALCLERGFVLTIDYGYTAAEVSQGRRFPEGSLMSYFRHSAYPDVLRDPGERDITAHVNFTALVNFGKSLGLRALPIETQAQFLLSIGHADEFQGALAAANESEAQRHRMLLKTLLFGMGETFRVLVQEKG